MSFSFLHHVRSRRGFVVLFGVTFSAILIVIAASMFRLVDRETTLASTATESYFALYAADTGMDCVLFEEFIDSPSAGDPDTVNCLGAAISKMGGSAPYDPSDPYSVQIDFATNVGGIQTGCAVVVVTRNDMRDPNPFNGVADTPVAGTQIISQGYNTCLNGVPNLESPTVVERRFEAWFPTP